MWNLRIQLKQHKQRVEKASAERNYDEELLVLLWNQYVQICRTEMGAYIAIFLNNYQQAHKQAWTACAVKDGGRL